MRVDGQDGKPAAEEVDIRLWGKSRGLPQGRQYPLVCHLLDTGAAARCLWDTHVPDGLRKYIADGFGVTVEHAGALIALWATLHDIGKLTPEFQRRDPHADLSGYPGGSGKPPAHDLAGHKWLQCALADLGYAADEMIAPGFSVPQLIGGHHGTFHRGLTSLPRRSPLLMPGVKDDLWERQRKVTFSMVQAIVGSPEPPPTSTPGAAALACAIIVLADWLVSQESHLVPRLDDLPASGADCDLRAYFAKSLGVAADLIARAGLTQQQVRPGGFSETFPHISQPNELQRSVAEHLPGLVHGPGLLVVMAPPGMGKTETALYAAKVLGEASGRPGVYMALPTTATADQIYLRIRRYLESQAEIAAPLMLLHGMAWLNSRYLPDEESSPVLTGEADDGSQFAAADWLRGRWRGMCGSWAVGTIDQALMAVLTSRHNALRLFGLAGKTVIIDEVHACDPYMQGLLLVLLRWLGSLGTPVVLLSATLTRSVARELVTAYLEGAHGKGSPAVHPERDFGCYPGWAYADAVTGEVTVASAALDNELDLAVSVREVSARDTPGSGSVVPDRGPALREELRPLVESGGCALVICTTVNEAQETFCGLRDWFAELSASVGTSPELELLHARFPAWQREEITERVMERYGKNDNGARPRAAVVVATAIVEQSLDLDFDLIISDLAPVALLLQRAGRCWRHQEPGKIARPAWATGPRLSVLVPPGGPDKPQLFRSWTAIYYESLLTGTYRLLSRRNSISIPADVQQLIDDVYMDPELVTGAEVEKAWSARIGDEIAQREISKLVAIPGPRDIDSLYPLTASEVEPELLATRFNADSVRALPVFVDTTGGLWLDRGCRVRLPVAGRPTPADCKAVYRFTVPVRGGPWLRQPDIAAALPESWRRNTHLRDLVLLRQRAQPGGSFSAALAGGREFRLDDILGLCITTNRQPL
jgi:CRISPR-associated endonuclease/helicase Cas3